MKGSRKKKSDKKSSDREKTFRYREVEKITRVAGIHRGTARTTQLCTTFDVQLNNISIKTLRENRRQCWKGTGEALVEGWAQ